jgi:hypothetical protein
MTLAASSDPKLKAAIRSMQSNSTNTHCSPNVLKELEIIKTVDIYILEPK